MQQKNGLKAMLLERKLNAVESELEKKETQLGEVLKAANLDESTHEQVTSKLDEVLESKNELIRALQYDLDKMTKTHNDLISVYEAKLAEFGIPAEELGFKPQKPNPSHAPAGLVTS